jgi:F-type H+-transporting ATPase subunit epsilon
MAKPFHLTVARIGENAFDGEVVSVTLPTQEGIITVMANHEALVSPLKEGKITIETSSGEKHIVETTATGLLEVSNNQATVIL